VHNEDEARFMLNNGFSPATSLLSSGCDDGFSPAISPLSSGRDLSRPERGATGEQGVMMDFHQQHRALVGA